MPNPDPGDLIPMTAGERIVAFARPGKPPETPILRPMERIPGHAKGHNCCEVSTVSKVAWRRG